MLRSGGIVRVDEALRILEVPPSATPAEIKAAYRRMVKVCHPDRHALDEGRRARAEETLKRVVEAYQCLRHGVPAAPPPEPRTVATATPGSTFSVRQAASTRRRRSEPRTRRRAAGWLWHVAVWLPAIAALGLLALMVVLGSAPNPESIAASSLPSPWSSQGSAVQVVPRGGVVAAARASHRGLVWRVQNPTRRTWRGCIAWVGAKWLSLEVLRPGEELTLPARRFSPVLSLLDEDKTFELRCVVH